MSPIGPDGPQAQSRQLVVDTADLYPTKPDDGPAPGFVRSEYVTAVNEHPIKAILAVIVGAIVAEIAGVGNAFGLIFFGAIIAYGVFWHQARAHHDQAMSQHRAFCAANAHWYENECEWWRWTRPLAIIDRADDKLAEAFNQLPVKKSGYLGVTQETQTMVAAERNQSVLVLAPTQRGKTTGINIPMMVTHRGPAVSASTKLDVFNATYGARSRLGRVWIFDPSGEIDRDELPPGVTWLRWSPLWDARRWDDAKRTATGLIGATPVGAESTNPTNAHWTISAERFLGPLLFAAALHQDCDILSVRTWVNFSDFETPNAILQDIADSPTHPCRTGAVIAMEELQSIAGMDDRQRSSVISTAQTVTNVYSYESVLGTCVDQNFDPDAFVRSTDTVFIATSSKMQASTAPLIAGFLQAIQVATYAYNQADPFDKSTRPSVLIALDEAANIAPVKALPSYLSEGGGQGLQVVAYMQTLTQAELIWPVQGRNFLGYFAVKVALGGLSDKATLEMLSVLCGDYDRVYVAYSETDTVGITNSTAQSFGFSGGLAGQSNRSTSVSEGVTTSHSSGTTQSIHKERRLTDGDIASLQPGTALVIDQNNVHQIVELVGTWTDPWRSIVDTVAVTGSTSPAPRIMTDRGLPKLASVDALVAAAEAKALAKTAARTAPPPAAPQTGSQPKAPPQAGPAAAGAGTKPTGPKAPSRPSRQAPPPAPSGVGDTKESWVEGSWVSSRSGVLGFVQAERED